MNDKHKILLYFIIIMIILIIILIISVLLIKRDSSETENDSYSKENNLSIENLNEGGVEYDDAQLNNININTNSLTEIISDNAINFEYFSKELKKYIYINGLVDASNAILDNSDIINNELELIIQLDNSKNTKLRAKIDINSKDIYIDEVLTDWNTFFELENKLTESYNLANGNNANFKSKIIYKNKIEKEDKNVTIYDIEGTLYTGNESVNKEDISTKIIVDNINNTYLIKSSEEITENDYTIKDNGFNKFSTTSISDSEKAQELLERYIFYALNDSELSYTMISDITKKSSFDTFEKYNGYILEHKNELEKTYIVAYKTEKIDNYDRYIVKDQYDNYYIFDVKSPSDYTITIQ